MAFKTKTKSREGNGEREATGVAEEVEFETVSSTEEGQEEEKAGTRSDTSNAVVAQEGRGKGDVGSGPETDLAPDSSTEFTEVISRKVKKKRKKKKIAMLSIGSDTVNSDASSDEDRPPPKTRTERLKDRTGRKEESLTPVAVEEVEAEPSKTKTTSPQEEEKVEEDEVSQLPEGEGDVFSDPMVRMTNLVQKDVERLLTHKSNKMAYGIQNEIRCNVAKLVAAVMDLQIRNVMLTTAAKSHKVEKKTFAQVAKANLAQVTKANEAKPSGKSSEPKARAPTVPAKPRPKKGSLLVFPKGEVKSVDALKSVLKKTINPSQLKVKVLTLRRVENNGVLIETATEAGSKLMRAAIDSAPQLKDCCTTKEVQPPNPSLVIYSLEDERTNEELVKDLREQGDLLGLDVKVKKKLPVGYKRYHLVIELPKPLTSG